MKIDEKALRAAMSMQWGDDDMDEYYRKGTLAILEAYESAKTDQPDELPEPKCPDGGCHGACPYCYGFYEGQESCAPFMRKPDLETATLTVTDKYAIADKIVIESRSKSDVVQDVFDELAKLFELRRRG